MYSNSLALWGIGYTVKYCREFWIYKFVEENHCQPQSSMASALCLIPLENLQISNLDDLGYVILKP
jgi:hypothetical protein